MNMNRLRDLREDKDLTQADLANILHCSQSTYSRYESEEVNVPLDLLKKLATFYDVSVDYLIGFSGKKK